MSLNAKLTPVLSARLGLLDEQASVADGREQLRRAWARAGATGPVSPEPPPADDGSAHRALLETLREIERLERSLDELQHATVVEAS